MKKTTETVREYNEAGQLIKETFTEVTEDFGPQPYTPSNPWTYPNTPVNPWTYPNTPVNPWQTTWKGEPNLVGGLGSGSTGW